MKGTRAVLSEEQVVDVEVDRVVCDFFVWI